MTNKATGPPTAGSGRRLGEKCEGATAPFTGSVHCRRGEPGSLSAQGGGNGPLAKPYRMGGGGGLSV